jgi:hypothetical protein
MQHVQDLVLANSNAAKVRQKSPSRKAFVLGHYEEIYPKILLMQNSGPVLGFHSAAMRVITMWIHSYSDLFNLAAHSQVPYCLMIEG